MHETWFEKIEEYLNGNMAPEERLHFESEIATNEELSALFVKYRAIDMEMRNEEKYSTHEAALKGTLEKLNAVYFNKAGIEENKKPGEVPVVISQGNTAPEGGPLLKQLPVGYVDSVKRINTWKTLAVAAGILGIVSLSILWLFNSLQNNRHIAIKNKNAAPLHNHSADTTTGYAKRDTPLLDLNAPVAGIGKPQVQSLYAGKTNSGKNDAARRLFAENFTPDAVPSEIPPLLQEPMADYKAARHQDAIAAFDAANPDQVTRGMEEDRKLVLFYIHYYKAQSYLATNQAVRAIGELHEAIRKRPDRFSKSKVNWYLGLAYLKNGDIKKAEPLLQQLAGSSTAGKYKHKAANLLKAIVQ